MEKWSDVPEYEGLYRVSNLGRVFSVRKDKVLKPAINRWGYERLTLVKSGVKKNYSVHRLVAACFCKKTDGCDVVNHLDENKTNNAATNLEWTTYTGNNLYGTAPLRRSVNTDHYARNAGRKRPVVQLSLNGDIIKVFDCSRSASITLGICASQITSCCRSRPKRKTAGGYVWKYSRGNECPIIFETKED